MGHGISQLENCNLSFKGDTNEPCRYLEVENKAHLFRSSGRVYLEEFFHKLPSINASAAYSVNENFEVLGTNGSADDVTFSTTRAGIQLQTDGATNDQVIILPHLASGLSAWTGIKWGTENQVIWECAISTAASITDCLFWAGLKLTNTSTVATDADQVFFRFQQGTDTYWVVESSIGGTDTATASTVTPAVNTIYRFRIIIDSSRRAHCYINDAHVYTTAALTNDVDFIPYVGVQDVGAGAAQTLILHYEKISRILYE